MQNLSGDLPYKQLKVDSTMIGHYHVAQKELMTAKEWNSEQLNDAANKERKLIIYGSWTAMTTGTSSRVGIALHSARPAFSFSSLGPSLETWRNVGR